MEYVDKALALGKTACAPLVQYAQRYAAIESVGVVTLFLFASWAVVLVGLLLSLRVLKWLTGTPMSRFRSTGSVEGKTSTFEDRVGRAYLNTAENLPLLTALVFAVSTSVPFTKCIGETYFVIIVARVLQSTFHLISGNSFFVSLRFTAYVTQLGGFVYLALQYAKAMNLVATLSAVCGC